ncbi:hypothetical protein BOTBODRAFT_194963 [Botryobasidium botryosum FD-172 SS1]|uniref:Amino acid permease/ SLC12A domain-containing protein n=1 Tax=Botryobasidium botryosum (strain FD-172 SS1) TaxID=930990 RepID=A0A067NAN3_BOTB1|nr:hypothetical protein BOTBODRAFT_194963 [Botryobasidium botryosum FD-172 SS1]
MMSIGGAIGTGLFLGTAEALRRGGPVGVLLGYVLVGTVVYCVAVSLGEIVAYRPHIGGIIGITDEYVDPALSFAPGWLAWYHWAIVCPTEISAAVTLMDFYGLQSHNAVWVTIILFLSTAVNCLCTRVYGEIEFWFSSVKVVTVIVLVIFGLLADFGAAGQGVIGFRYWNHPGPFAQYMGIAGTEGRFLGFFQILMQAVFSYLGAEIPSIAAGEVIDPSRNIPQSLKRVWIRIFVLYVSTVAVMGLLLPYNDPALHIGSGNASASIFVIVMQRAGIKVLPQILNAAFLMSAWSAGTVDIYVASRYLWFLAYRNHAPLFFRRLYRSRPKPRLTQYDEKLSKPDAEASTDNGGHTDISNSHTMRTTMSSEIQEIVDHSSSEREIRGPKSDIEKGRCASPISESNVLEDPDEVVVPYVGVLASFAVGLLAYTSIGGNAKKAFSWLSSMTSTAALLSWVAMMYTYIRWYRGTMWAEAHRIHPIADDLRLGDPIDNLTTNHPIINDPANIIESMHNIPSDSKDLAMNQAKTISKSNYTPDLEVLSSLRHRGQPYLAMYALFMCTFILVCNGWATLFAGSAEGKFIIAQERNQNKTASFDGSLTGNLTLIEQEFPPQNDIAIFITTYLPIPIFLLLIFGYKLINQTPIVAYEDMRFEREPEPLPATDAPVPRSRCERVLDWLI